LKYQTGLECMKRSVFLGKANRREIQEIHGLSVTA